MDIEFLVVVIGNITHYLICMFSVMMKQQTKLFHNFTFQVTDTQLINQIPAFKIMDLYLSC